MQRQIRARAREERREGKTAKLEFNKLTIKGEEWKCNKPTD